MAVGRFALKAGDDDHIAVVEIFMDFLRGNVLDFGLGVHTVGLDAGLGAGERDRVDAQRVQGHGRQGNGRLFAGGEQDVHLALVGQRHDLLGQFDEIVGHAAHGGNDHDDLVAPGAIPRHARRDVLDPVGVADRSPAEFLNNE